MKLLSFGNMKLQKNAKRGVLTAGLHLAPHKSSGVVNVCGKATKACIKLCLGNSCGGFRFQKIKDAQIARTRFFHERPKEFLAQLTVELKMLEFEAELKGMEAAARLNVVSDILWEKHIDTMCFPKLKFYDYTKHSLKDRQPAPNYHLVYSISERKSSWAEAERWMAAGHNAVLVVGAEDSDSDKDHKAVIAQIVAKGYLAGYPCISGDDSDLRFYEGTGKLVLLYPKGHIAKKDRSGFVHRYALES